MADDPGLAGLSGLSALVTGGGSGIGLGVAKRLASDGAMVTLCGRTQTKLTKASELIARDVPSAPAVDYVVGDVTVEDDVHTVIDSVLRRADRLDILFACAGGSLHMGPLVTADAGAVRATIDLNLVGSFLCVKHAAPAMYRHPGGGSMILMSSGAGHFPHRHLWAYGTAKAGIEMLCRYAAEELGERGIRVNAVQPGIIDDELMAPITAGGPLLDDYLLQMPLARLGTVEDVAEAVRFLAGPESRWITGACLPIDGGHHLRRGADYSLLGG
jgi:NAD(P)-dependent dehydrogenase (short-subunit alcohol dehydrogenase family)